MATVQSKSHILTSLVYNTVPDRGPIDILYIDTFSFAVPSKMVGSHVSSIQRNLNFISTSYEKIGFIELLTTPDSLSS